MIVAVNSNFEIGGEMNTLAVIEIRRMRPEIPDDYLTKIDENLNPFPKAKRLHDKKSKRGTRSMKKRRH
jgi:hypothetical protein